MSCRSLSCLLHFLFMPSFNSFPWNKSWSTAKSTQNLIIFQLHHHQHHNACFLFMCNREQLPNNINLWQAVTHHISFNVIITAHCQSEWYSAFLRKTEKNLEGEEYSHLVLSCSSQHWRRMSDNGAPENPDVLWLHTIISVACPRTVYWPLAPLETWGNADDKKYNQGTHVALSVLRQHSITLSIILGNEISKNCH